MYYKLNAASEEAKELLTQKICETFLCHNWGPHNSNNEADSEITVYGDRLFSVPESILPDVLPWIMQYRISRLNSPAEINLDIAVHPNTNMGTKALNVYQFFEATSLLVTIAPQITSVIHCLN